MAKLGDQLSGSETITFDRRIVALDTRNPPRHEHLVYYKPVGEVSTRNDPQGRPTIFDGLPKLKSGRWISVGRLDVNSCGLLLLTTDGRLAHRLMHPRYEILRTYAVRIFGTMTDPQRQRLLDGVSLDDGMARFDSVHVRQRSTGRNSWVEVSLREGRKREIRRCFEAVGLTVSRLIRVRYGPIELGRMRRGDSRRLSANELTALYAAVDLSGPATESRSQKKETGPRRRSAKDR